MTTPETIEYGGDLQYTRKGRCLGDVYTPKKPYVGYSNNAKVYKPEIRVNNKMIVDELHRSGLHPELARGVALSFHTHADNLPREDVHIGGWHSPFGLLRFKNKREPVYHVVAAHVVLPQDEEGVNKTLWHELGHAHEHLVKKVKKDVLYTKKNVKRAERAAVGLASSGVLLMLPQH